LPSFLPGLSAPWRRRCRASSAFRVELNGSDLPVEIQRPGNAVDKLFVADFVIAKRKAAASRAIE